MDKAKVNVWKSDTRTCMRMTLKTGWTWSACIGPNMPGQPTVCPGHHFGFLESGTFKMIHGEVETIVKAGMCYECKPGHTAEVIGEDEAIMIEFSQQEVMEKMVDEIKEEKV